MCDLDTYRARIGLFRCVLTVKRTVLTGENIQVREGTTHDTGVSSIDMLCTFLFCWLWVLLCVSAIGNIQNIILEEITIPTEKTETTATMVCCQHVWDRTDSISCQSLACVLALHGPAIVSSVCVVNLFFAMWRLRLSGDVEENPGPDPAPSQPETERGTKGSESDTGMSAAMDDFFIKITNTIQQQLNDQTSVLRHDMCEMRKDLSDIRSQCEQINDRCDRLEKDQQELSDNVAVLSADIGVIYKEVTEGREETQAVKISLQELEGEVQNLTSEIDRLEGFSRRDNLRFFGITPNSDQENGDMCVTALVNTLNSADSNRKWTEQDIVRAHRVGQARYGKPRPMIARMSRWKDKMNIITDKDFKEKLKQNGVGVANDLTRRQANIVAQAKREGRRAFFRNGTMVMGPILTDARTYAQATRSDSTEGAADSNQGNTGGVSPTGRASGQGRGHHHEESPGDDTLTQRARPPIGAVNCTNGDSWASPREARAGKDQHCDTRAGKERQPLDCGGDRGQENSLHGAGPSTIGQPGQGEGRGKTVSLQHDVTDQIGGSRVGQSAGGSGRGTGVSPHGDVTRRDVARRATGTDGVRRGSASRQTGLRSFLGNHSGGGGSDRSLRNKKGK